MTTEKSMVFIIIATLAAGCFILGVGAGQFLEKRKARLEIEDSVKLVFDILIEKIHENYIVILRETPITPPDK